MADGVTPATWDEALDTVLAEMRALMVARQAKYGPQNVRDQGLYGVITRAVADKVARILRALNGRVVNGRVELDPITDAETQDTFEDGLFDAANYLGPIALMVHRGWWDLPRAVTARTVTSGDDVPSDPSEAGKSCEEPCGPSRIVGHVTVENVSALSSAYRFPLSATATSSEPRARCLHRESNGPFRLRCWGDEGHAGPHSL